MKRVKEVSALVGVTRRTLQYYDDEGLLFAKRSKDNHRLYDDAAIKRLWQILFYREIGFELNEIKRLISLQEDECSQMLDERIKAMTDTRDQLDAQISFAKAVKKYGIPPVCCTDDEPRLTYVESIDILKQIFINGFEKDTLHEENCSTDGGSEAFNVPEEFAKWVNERYGEGSSEIIAKVMKMYQEKRGEDVNEE